MLLAAQARGYELQYLDAGRPVPARRRRRAAGPAPLTRAGRSRRTGSHSASRRTLPLGDFDVILMRKDPPFDMEFIYTTYILERAELAGRAGGEPAAGPARHEREGLHGLVPGVLRADADHPRHGRHGRLRRASTARSSVKPLHGMGGRSIFVVDAGDKNLRVVFETLTDYGQRFAIVQRYLPRDRGDRRFARAADRRRAGALCAGAHARGHRQPRQPGRRRQGRGRGR